MRKTKYATYCFFIELFVNNNTGCCLNCLPKILRDQHWVEIALHAWLQFRNTEFKTHNKLSNQSCSVSRHVSVSKQSRDTIFQSLGLEKYRSYLHDFVKKESSSEIGCAECIRILRTK